MTSLEIVNKGLKKLNRKILGLKKIIQIIDKNDILLNEYKISLNDYEKQYKNFNKIKQDLEVLEILKNYIGISKYEQFNAIEIALLIDRGSVKEQFDKVMKWMEENK